jgi:hypothetical protein
VADPIAEEVERRLGRPFSQIRDELEEFFGSGWEEVEVVIETSAHRHDRSAADVIVDLVSRAGRRPAVRERVRRSLVRWIGKPWRERPNPWERFKGRVPPLPPRLREEPSDLDEWTPLRPDDGPRRAP